MSLSSTAPGAVQSARVALLTPPGRGALAVVGIAGPGAAVLVDRLFAPRGGAPLAARVDGATGWASFWHVTFPLMLPVSVTTIILRIIFQLKLADIVINTTLGGPGGATDTISSFIFREYRDRSNVGYGTMVAEVYLVIIIVFITILLNLVGRFMRREAVQ
jgi:ABC-type spermidine/putrescine transport system permease subunit II